METNNKVIQLHDYIQANQQIKTIDDFRQKKLSLTPSDLITKRFWAFLVDITFIMICNIIINQSYALFIGKYLNGIPYQKKVDLLQGNFILSGIVFLTVYSGYFFYCNYILNGKTLGKKVMNLRVVNQEFIFDHSQFQSHISLKIAFQRTFGYLLCYLSFGIFFIFHFTSENRRGLPDFLSATQTVSDDWIQYVLDARNHQEEVICRECITA